MSRSLTSWRESEQDSKLISPCNSNSNVGASLLNWNRWFLILIQSCRLLLLSDTWQSVHADGDIPWKAGVDKLWSPASEERRSKNQSGFPASGVIKYKKLVLSISSLSNKRSSILTWNLLKTFNLTNPWDDDILSFFLT